MTAGEFDLARYARQLPQPAPGDDVFYEIVQAHAARRKRHSAFAGVALLLAVVAATGFWLHRATSPFVPEETQRLSGTSGVELRAVDRALQAAYDRRADDAELAALWSRREALQRGDPGPLPLEL